MSILDIVPRLHGFANENDIRVNLDMLINEGHVYTTLDDDHVQSNIAY